MAKYLLTEDQEGKSGYTFWKTLMSELFPDINVVSKQNNRGVLKAVKNIKYDMNIKNVLCGLLVVLLIVIGGTLIYMDNVKSGSKQQVNSDRENIRNCE